MKLKVFLDNPFEIMWGTCINYPMSLIVGMWSIPMMIASGILWRVGGMAGGNKLARRLGVPAAMCVPIAIILKEWVFLGAIPFMVWLAPSYGKEAFLYEWAFSLMADEKKADTLTRLIITFVYWFYFIVFLILSRWL